MGQAGAGGGGLLTRIPRHKAVRGGGLPHRGYPAGSALGALVHTACQSLAAPPPTLAPGRQRMWGEGSLGKGPSSLS